VLLRINKFIFNQQPRDPAQKVVYTYHKSMVKSNQLVYFYKVNNDDAQEEDPQKLQINEIDDECAFQGEASNSTTPNYKQPIKMNKHNIGIKEVPIMVVNGDY
jgi:hypothetical protein